ncbi:hypothetical protein [Pelomonas aquatica]|jgi:hypothetical protein|uniref:Uncharacterized protein n=1 Tax=Pelomonas aquatica TaxID=431058 RepID=A0A9X4LDZ8_9BURK|nr:hypothetical protein [Pelomonas aquatica]MCY4755406.1 hypothetical protein [Pelomonas aquatica]MDG0861727.1 hypothetical protein [Pelomonas aquatica]
MDFVDEIDAVSRVRVGEVLGPEAVRAQGAQFLPPLEMECFSLGVSVPNWLVCALEGNAGRLTQFGVIRANGSSDLFGFCVAQSKGTQLRVLMSLHAADVRKYLQDCSHRGRLHMLLTPENTSQVLALEMPGRFSSPALLAKIFEDCPLGKTSAEAVTELTRLIADVNAVPSLFEGVQVTDAIAVVIADVDLLRALRALRDAALGQAGSSACH